MDKLKGLIKDKRVIAALAALIMAVAAYFNLSPSSCVDSTTQPAELASETTE